jgi:DNA-binding response OmpR family regulator
MPVPIVIFSADEIRGKIILNALRFKGFDVLLHNKTITADNIISNNTPSVVILDTKGFFPNELEYFESAYSLLSESALIVLADPSEANNFELKNIRMELCKSDPLDAELIVSRVNALLARKRGSAEERKSEVGNQKSEDNGNEEAKDEEHRLKDDLKQFLDLE